MIIDKLNIVLANEILIYIQLNPITSFDYMDYIGHRLKDLKDKLLSN